MTAEEEFELIEARLTELFEKDPIWRRRFMDVAITDAMSDQGYRDDGRESPYLDALIDGVLADEYIFSVLIDPDMVEMARGRLAEEAADEHIFSVLIEQYSYVIRALLDALRADNTFDLLFRQDSDLREALLATLLGNKRIFLLLIEQNSSAREQCIKRAATLYTAGQEDPVFSKELEEVRKLLKDKRDEEPDEDEDPPN